MGYNQVQAARGQLVKASMVQISHTKACLNQLACV